ncbi:MAG TPA: hypothetical protein VMU14_22270 [Acidimicrobiales bacterium]|nr:hypothetical protein [Acidimicrobiales bacterium]
MRPSEHPLWCGVAGAVLGGLAAAGLALAGALPSIAPTPAPPAPGSAAAPGPAARPAGAAVPGAAAAVPGAAAAVPGVAERFLAAWRAHLMASWSVDEVDVRTTTSGSTLRFDVHDAQAPPDAVLVGNGTVSARRGGVQLACGPGRAGQPYACRSVPTALPWAQDVDRQLATLRAEVEGPAAFYTVHDAGPGCWSLVLVKPSAEVPVVAGRGATYCLDLATGALRSSEVQRVGAVDRVTVTAAHAPAGPADLALPSGVGDPLLAAGA